MAFSQYKINETADKCLSIMKEWIDRGNDLTFINNVIIAGFVTSEYDVPQTLHIKVKQEEKAIYYYNNERYQWSLNKMIPAQCRCHLLNNP